MVVPTLTEEERTERKSQLLGLSKELDDYVMMVKKSKCIPYLVKMLKGPEPEVRITNETRGGQDHRVATDCFLGTGFLSGGHRILALFSKRCVSVPSVVGVGPPDLAHPPPKSKSYLLVHQHQPPQPRTALGTTSCMCLY